MLYDQCSLNIISTFYSGLQSETREDELWEHIMHHDGLFLFQAIFGFTSRCVHSFALLPMVVQPVLEEIKPVKYLVLKKP